MADPATAFANAFDQRFRALTKGFRHDEIHLFQSMHGAIVGLSGNFEIEEYHGTSHQVEFTGNGSYARTNARCEMSDLMIVTFSSHVNTARLTYLQAKYERATLPLACGHKFSANLEQWFLLAQRPPIIGVGKFAPPTDILSSALLASVGSFAFFYKDLAGDFQTYYAAANHLTPPRKYSQSKGKLIAKGPCHVGKTGIYKDCSAVCGNYAFAKSLYSLEIGTPIDGSVAQAMSTRNWLAANLRARIRKAEEANAPSGLAQELLPILASESDDSPSGSFGAKHLVIIKSRAEPRNERYRPSVGWVE